MVVDTTQSASLSALPPADFIFGSTPAMQEVRLKIERALEDDRPVLIEGENGTGKEVVARYLHLCSSRADGPFVRVNCGAMPAEPLEEEIFGAKRASSSIGLAAGGTLFLDDIGDMDPALQGRLFDRLKTPPEAFQYGKPGLTKGIRLVCASTVDIDPAARSLRGLAVELAMNFAHRLYLLPLRDRKQDIPKLCGYLIERFARSFTRPVPMLSPFVLDAFQEWDWPGNIRELENWIARIVIFGTEDAIGLEFMRQMRATRRAAARGHRVIRMSGTRPQRRRRS